MRTKEKLDIISIQKIVQKSSLTVIKEMMDEVNPLIDELKSDAVSQHFKTPLTNYVIIRLVSIVETYFRNFTIDLIDKYNFPIKGIFSNDEITISLLDLDEIRKNEKITEGRIIAQAINFQNIHQVNLVLSKLLGGKSFLKLMNLMLKNTLFGDKPHADKDSYWFDWKEFLELFPIRHDIVHHMQSDKTTDMDKLIRFTTHVAVFCSVSEILLVKEYLKNYGVEFKKKDLKSYEDVEKRLKEIEKILFIKSK